MKKLSRKQKQLIIQLLIKNKQKQLIKGINILTKQEADEYIKDLLNKGK